jgi:hypothetical protein
MAEIHWLAVHEWATSDYALNAASLALADGCVGDAPLAKGAVEPDTFNSALSALANQLDGHVRVRGNHDPVDGSWNGAEVRVASHAFDFGGVRIDRECLVPGVAQLAVHGVGWLPRFPRHTGYGDAFAAEELGNRLRYVDHP